MLDSRAERLSGGAAFANQLVQPLLEDIEYRRFAQTVIDRRAALAYAMAEPQKAYIAAGLRGSASRPILYVAPTEQQALRTAGDLTQLLGPGVSLFPPREVTFYHTAASSQEVAFRRVETMQAVASGRAAAVVASADALLTCLPPRGAFSAFMVTLSVGMSMPPKDLLARCVRMGYERVERVEAKGQCALRGGILDIYPTNAADALRIEFFDEEIDSMRVFSAQSQRSQSNLSEWTIPPASELPLTDEQAGAAADRLEESLYRAVNRQGRASGARGRAKPQPDGGMTDPLAMPALDEMRVDSFARTGTTEAKLTQYIQRSAEMIRAGAYPAGMEQFIPYCCPRVETLADWMEGAVVILDEPDKIRERCVISAQSFAEAFKAALERGEALPEQASLLADPDDLFASLAGTGDARRGVAMFSAFLRTTAGLKPDYVGKLEGVAASEYQGNTRELAADLKKWRGEGWRVAIMIGGAARGKRLTESLYDIGISCERPEDEARLNAPLTLIPRVLPASFSRGFVMPGARLALLSESDVYGGALRKARQMKSSGERIAAFTDLKVGDFVVHESHGVGQYKGTVRLSSEGRWRDYIYIQYHGADKLYIPTDQMDRVHKYIGGDSDAPRLNKLGGSEWRNQKARVKQSIRAMAFDLVKLYAKRASTRGHAFSPDTPWQAQFEEFFPYEETPDQLQAVADIKRDMESQTPMDRLLCGDVGYGKTEVALRAAFKAVMDGKQAAILAPTTVLTQQHYHTILERFKGFPVRCESVSRFKSPAQIKAILKNLEAGEIDILVGTHRLLAKDVRFKSLGLLVVDEEQRFGVAHKESIKNMKAAVDVLTLSATPIPRTLHMSMVGIRDMSLLETPPEERYPVQTYVMEYSDGIVRDAILRELGRGGQVYMVYNHVESIERMYERARDLVPEARIAIGHGQMREHVLEDVMVDFYDGKYDVLLCTTIIESGLDVPRANTLIVCESDHFGLSQLYQLRGRVGRSNRVAYAYLTIQPDRSLSETADKRLQAIREFTQFGSGFRIAMRDLEIRGAGNLLGAEQHGFLSAVGYDMYCKLLEQTVREMRGDFTDEPEPIETRIELHVDAFLPGAYVEDEKQRVELYQKIAALPNRIVREDLEEELTDRFGDIPQEARALLDIALLKNLVNRLGVDLISRRDDMIRMRFAPLAKPDPGKLVSAIMRADPRLSLGAGGQNALILRGVRGTDDRVLAETLKAVEKVMDYMEEEEEPARKENA
ncbi:MAG: transcription-repair coupling factor [Oscillospiraceae bacterium]|jgi:transcription-repair coupling factor (superfamily II helicase)|nr:transcription-repair coupling factor [Oscillospiraceae bacterium]